MLYLWLQTWRQTMLKGLLVLLILVNGVFWIATWSSKDGLSGWWIEDQRRSGFGYLADEVVCHRMRLPEWWDKVTLGWQWAKVGLWTGLAVGLGWQSGGGSSWGWLVVIVASHQARSALAGVQEEMRVRLYWQVLSRPEVSPEIVSLGRVVEAPEIERMADRQQDVQADKQKSDQKEGRTFQPARPAQEMGQMLAQVVEEVPIGTNLGLLHMLWMLVSGQLLFSRGAIFPALQRMGLSAPAVRRAWAAFAPAPGRFRSYWNAGKSWSNKKGCGRNIALKDIGSKRLI